MCIGVVLLGFNNAKSEGDTGCKEGCGQVLKKVGLHAEESVHHPSGKVKSSEWAG